MLGFSNSVRIFLFSDAVDMRKGFNGLCHLVSESGEDVYQGHLYVFLSKRRNRAKILSFQQGGFVLWYKRLEQGRFRPLKKTSSSTHAVIDGTELMMLLDGIDVSKVKRAQHWRPKKSTKTDRQRASNMI